MFYKLPQSIQKRKSGGTRYQKVGTSRLDRGTNDDPAETEHPRVRVEWRRMRKVETPSK